MPNVNFSVTICSLCGTDSQVRLCRLCGEPYCYECTKIIEDEQCIHKMFAPIHSLDWEGENEQMG